MCRGQPDKARRARAWLDPCAGGDPRKGGALRRREREATGKGSTNVSGNGDDELIFALEVDGNDGVDVQAQKPGRLDSSTRDALKFLTEPDDVFCIKLCKEVSGLWLSIDPSLPFSARIYQLGRCLAAMQYKVLIRSGLGLKRKAIYVGTGFKPVANTNPECLEHIRHEFLVVQQPILGARGRVLSSKEIVVEPSFRDHFLIPHMNQRYRSLLNCLPEVFVGSRVGVKDLVRLMSKEMESVFLAVDREIPPWRKFGSMLSKWMPKKFKDQAIQSDAADAGRVICIPTMAGHEPKIRAGHLVGSSEASNKSVIYEGHAVVGFGAAN